MEKPLYIKIDQYEDIMSVLDQARERLNETKAKISELKELREKEKAFLENWDKDTKLIETKIGEVSTHLNTKQD